MVADHNGGTADPMFPLEHGEVLAEEIHDARLLPLEGAGHGVFEPTGNIVGAIGNLALVLVPQ